AADPLGAGAQRHVPQRASLDRPFRHRRAEGGDRAAVLAAEEPDQGPRRLIKAPFDVVTLATPFFVLTVILEILLARFGKTDARYETKDTAASLLMGLGSTLAGVFTGGIVAAATLWVYQHRVFTVPTTAIWAWVAVFFLEDLTYYWFHRISHER